MSSFFRQPYSEQKGILRLLTDLKSLEACSSRALFYKVSLQLLASRFHSQSPGCPGTSVRVFVKDHKSPVAKTRRPAARQLNSLSDAPYCQRKMRLCRLTGVKPRRTWSGTALADPRGWFGFLCELLFVLSAPKAPGCSFQTLFGAEGVRGGAGTSGAGAASSVLWRFLLWLKWTPHPNIFFCVTSFM